METKFWAPLILISTFTVAQVDTKSLKKFTEQSYDVAPSAKWINESQKNNYFISSIFNNQASGCGVVLSTNSGFDQQIHCSAKNENLNDTIQKLVSKGYYVSAISGCGISRWSIAFSVQKEKPKQQFLLGDHFPIEKIKELSASAYKITSISSNETKWFVIMSTDNDIGLQDFKSDIKIQRDFINEYWEKGYSITSINYGHDGLWTVVMSKTKSIHMQVYETDVAFPVEWIKKKWREGYRITSVAKGGSWLVVMSNFNENN